MNFLWWSYIWFFFSDGEYPKLIFPCFPTPFSDTLLKTTAEALGKWKDLLRNYTKTVDEEV
jgi:hypothetical protein